MGKTAVAGILEEQTPDQSDDHTGCVASEHQIYGGSSDGSNGQILRA